MMADTSSASISNITSLSCARPVVTITDDYTITSAMSGYVFFIATDAKTITLPKVADVEPGFWFTVVNSGANGNNIVTLSPNAADGIFGEIANASQDSAPSGANGKDLVNTKATAIKGDRVTLVADGTADWFVIEGVGIWASEA
jgi:hypothetical protein